MSQRHWTLCHRVKPLDNYENYVMFYTNCFDTYVFDRSELFLKSQKVLM